MVEGVDTSSICLENSQFDELTTSIRNRPMPWEGYQRASIISEEQLSLLRKYDHRELNLNNDLISDDFPEKYAELFIFLLRKLTRVDALQYILVLIDDMIEENPDYIDLYLSMKQVEPDLPYSVFQKCLEKEEDYLSAKACKIQTTFLNYEKTLPDFDFKFTIEYLVSALQRSTPWVVDVGIQILLSFLNVVPFRQLYYNTKDGIINLKKLLKSDIVTPQMQYQIIFCIWLLTFDEKIASQIQIEFDIIPDLIEIVRQNVKEKVLRVVIATFRNLMSFAPDANLPGMLANKILNYCETLLGKQVQDEDLVEDAEFLVQEIKDRSIKFSTFDAYSAEIESGKLAWTPPHLSEVFWTHNASRLNENDHRLLRILNRILHSSVNPDQLSIAVHDFGQYVKHFPHGKSFLNEIGAKEQIMQLMTHKNSDVRYHSVLAVQKFFHV